ncbi:MAG: alpha-2-macroglobulin family protein [Alphaproteobacteria bacterium]
MKRLLLALFIPLAFILAWGAGYSLYGSEGFTPRQKTPASADVNVVPPTTDQDAIDDASDGVELNPAAGDNFTYLGWEVDNAADEPKVCFNFYTALNAEDTIKVRDYISVSPSTSVAAEIDGNDLCLTGFSFDNEYEVTLKEGLADAAGKSLNRDIVEAVSFGDKPAYVGFAGQGIILPRVNAQGLAIETINVDTLSVSIARVSDRMMARRDPQGGESTMEGDYGWEGEDAAKTIRDVIWSGDVAVKTVRNKKVTTVLPLAKLTGDLPPGGYVVVAERAHEDNENYVARAWRWIISTDLVLTSYSGDDGLSLSARSIDTAKLQRGIEVTLVAENNDILAKAVTDAAGHVTFPAPLLKGKGPKRAKMVMAFGPENDYAILDLSRAALDLSEYDINGRRSSSSADMYGFTERGVYRPGETAHFTIMLRDSGAGALLDRPAKLIVRRPNGIEMITHDVSKKEIAEHSGTITWDYEIPDTAPRGVWSVGVEAEGAGHVGRVEFSVEDFVPQKLRLGIEVSQEPMKASEIRDITLDAQFLYGAPGAALEAEAEGRLQLDPNPFPKFSDYSFGPAERDFNEVYLEFGGGMTDGDGKLTIPLDLDAASSSSAFPLRVEITAGVAEPGGRYVRDSVRVPVRSENSYIGIDPLYEGGRAPRGKPTELALVALGFDGIQKSDNVTWTLVEEDWDYHWYRENGSWRYRRDVRDIPLTSGSLALDANAPAVWSKLLTWGDYRLDVVSKDGAVAGHRFSVGWGRAETSDSPDQLRIGTSNSSVKAGDSVTLAINAPYAGEAELVIASDAVHMVKPVRLKEGASELTFNFMPEWGESVYAMLTLYTPRDVDGRPVPRRAVGISYIALDRTQQTLSLSIDKPEVIRPRTDHTFTVDVDGAPRGDTVWMNFAAVDEGILQITKYKSPDAANFFFGKKALGVDIRDDYGRMLNPNLGAPAIAKTGGDSLGGEGLTVVPTKTVALFSGPVQVKGGKAKIELTLPDFNGELRLMATAWTKTAVGSASEAVKVRDKVPAIMGLPRFLAPGDRAVATVSLDNVEGASGDYEAVLNTGGLVRGSDPITLNLQEGQRLDSRTDISASETGVDTLTLSVKGPSRYNTASTFPIQVRTPYMPVTTSDYIRLEPGQSYTPALDLISAYEMGSTDITVSFSRLPGLDPAPYVKSLARYPYGCTEQTVSSAMPLLYSADLGGIPGQSEKERRRELQKAVNKLAGRQSLDGSFGLWSAGDRYARPWVGVYTADFLYRAQEAGLMVPADVLSRARKATAEISRMPRYPNLQYDFPRNGSWGDQNKAEAAAYANFVLAREGFGNLGHMRYLYDNHRSKMKSPLSQAYLGAALSMMGDKARSKAAFESARSDFGYEDDKDYYQSPVRDVAGVIAAMTEAGQDSEAADLSEAFREAILDETYMNTQEKAYVILALKALMKTANPPKVTAKKVKLAGDEKRPAVTLYGKDLSDAPSFTSRDESTIWATVTVSGAPSEAPVPSAKGFSLKKQLFTMSGQPVTNLNVKQGQRFVVAAAFKSEINRSRTIVLADLLPAGFEIETILNPQDGALKDGSDGAYVWVGNISKFQVTEARDDRFIASLETYRKDTYIAAYIVRAVTAGDFVMPGAVLEDMYRPADRAVTQTRRITIAADPAL